MSALRGLGPLVLRKRVFLQPALLPRVSLRGSAQAHRPFSPIGRACIGFGNEIVVVDVLPGALVPSEAELLELLTAEIRCLSIWPILCNLAGGQSARVSPLSLLKQIQTS